MRVHLETRLAAPCSQVADQLRRPALLHHLSGPLLRFTPVAPAVLPAAWAPGQYEIGVRLFGLIDIGSQTIGIEAIEAPPGEFRLRDNGHSKRVRRWDHRIAARPGADGMTRYSDTIDIAAGLATPLVWGFAALLFRHRQNRLRALAAAGFAD